MQSAADKQSYRIAAVYTLGTRQPLSRSFIETKLRDFAGLSAVKAQQLAGHWFGTFQFRAIRES